MHSWLKNIKTSVNIQFKKQSAPLPHKRMCSSLFYSLLFMPRWKFGFVLSWCLVFNIDATVSMTVEPFNPYWRLVGLKVNSNITTVHGWWGLEFRCQRAAIAIAEMLISDDRVRCPVWWGPSEKRWRWGNLGENHIKELRSHFRVIAIHLWIIESEGLSRVKGNSGHPTRFRANDTVWNTCPNQSPLLVRPSIHSPKPGNLIDLVLVIDWEMLGC